MLFMLVAGPKGLAERHRFGGEGEKAFRPKGLLTSNVYRRYQSCLANMSFLSIGHCFLVLYIFLFIHILYSYVYAKLQ